MSANKRTPLPNPLPFGRGEGEQRPLNYEGGVMGSVVARESVASRRLVPVEAYEGQHRHKKGGSTRSRPNLTNHHYKERKYFSAPHVFRYGVNTPYLEFEHVGSGTPSGVLDPPRLFRWSFPLCPERPPATRCQPSGLETPLSSEENGPNSRR
jgi:hypothetical protein